MNSYIDIDTAQLYFDTRLHTEVWDESTFENQNKALVSATRIIDNLNFIGRKTDENQLFKFPRYPDTVIPNNIIYAVCEIALTLLDDIDMENEIDALKSIGFNYATLRTNYNGIYPEHIMAGVPSAIAWRYLQPYLIDPAELRIN